MPDRECELLGEDFKEVVDLLAEIVRQVHLIEADPAKIAWIYDPPCPLDDVNNRVFRRDRLRAYMLKRSVTVTCRNQSVHDLRNPLASLLGYFYLGFALL
jgi:hypothetical protein